MVNNKQAKQTMALPGGWDKYRPINKKLNNNIIVIIDSVGYLQYICKTTKKHMFF